MSDVLPMFRLKSKNIMSAKNDKVIKSLTLHKNQQNQMTIGNYFLG